MPFNLHHFGSIQGPRALIATYKTSRRAADQMRSHSPQGDRLSGPETRALKRDRGAHRRPISDGPAQGPRFCRSAFPRAVQPHPSWDAPPILACTPLALSPGCRPSPASTSPLAPLCAPRGAPASCIQNPPPSPRFPVRPPPSRFPLPHLTGWSSAPTTS